jgi:hypothetical protein
MIKAPPPVLAQRSFDPDQGISGRIVQFKAQITSQATFIFEKPVSFRIVH